jgi:ABC-type transporter Mla maintaining outer membrane lipid asymmetry ATPase subunit MlaF
MGQDLAEIMDEEWGELRTQVGTVLERPGLLSNMTMFNNVALPLRYHQTELTETDIQSRVMAQLEALGISALKDMFPAQLNQGEIRCAAIARALVSEPRIMLLDEPVSGLDAHMTRRLAQHLSYYRQKMPLTILATMRSYSELLEIVDRVILLNDGQIQAVGTPAEIAKSVTSDFRGYVTPGFGLS